MSWSSTPIEPADADHIGDAIDAAECVGNATVEHQFQLAAAKRAAKALIGDGAVGDSTGDRIYIVSMNGHANPDFKPVPGWANEMVNVSVRSEPADSESARYARENYERYQAQQVES